MGWFNGFGNFLGGYAQARRQKQLDRDDQHKEMMNQAMQWANIADRASGPGGDAVREMATKNMEDMIVQYEKSAGEKQGIAAIINMFKGKNKDKSNENASILNKIAPMLSQRIEPQSAPVPMTLSDNGPSGPSIEQPQSSVPQEVTPQVSQPQAVPVPPAQTPEWTGAMNEASAAGLPVDQSPPVTVQPNFNTVSDQAQAAAATPVASGINAPADAYAGNRGALERFKNISDTLAPGRSVFGLPYAGGTRHSPTYAEMEADRLAVHQKELDVESKQNEKNAETLANFQDKRKADEKARRIKVIRESGMDPEMKKRAELMVDADIEKLPEPTAYDLEIVGEPHLKNGQVYAENRLGKDMVYNKEWRKDNPIAASYLDAMKFKDKDLERATRLAGEYEEDKRKSDLAVNRAQINRMNHSSQNEDMQILQQNRLMLQQGQTNMLKLLDKVDDDYTKHEKTLSDKFGMISPTEFVTGIKPDGTKSTKSQGIKKPDGTVYTSLKDYEDDWKSKQLPAGLSVNRARVYVVTGVDPMGTLIGSYADEDTKKAALGYNLPKNPKNIPKPVEKKTETKPKPAPVTAKAPEKKTLPTPPSTPGIISTLKDTVSPLFDSAAQIKARAEAEEKKLREERFRKKTGLSSGS